MDEQEMPPLTITNNDIQEANQLSLHCPICANPVEKFVEDRELQPVICAKCGTLYHKVCWEQGGGKCAVLGCAHDKFKVYGTPVSPVLSIKYTDLPRPSANGRSSQNKRLKEEQRRQVEQLRRPSLLQRLFKWLLDQIKIG
jgi:transcription initiation factor TFIIIB Brf1 subunit/transcription initiation factor TFIIB